MRRQRNRFKLGRKTAHRRLLMRNLCDSLACHVRILTTLEKAKAVRPQFERLITKAIRATLVGTLDARVNTLRRLRKHVTTAQAASTLLHVWGHYFRHRSGGYTRIIRIGSRPSDGASLAIIELVLSDAGTEAINLDAENPLDYRTLRTHCNKKAWSTQRHYSHPRRQAVMHGEVPPLFMEAQPLNGNNLRLRVWLGEATAHEDLSAADFPICYYLCGDLEQHFYTVLNLPKGVVEAKGHIVKIEYGKHDMERQFFVDLNSDSSIDLRETSIRLLDEDGRLLIWMPIKALL